MVIMGQDEVCSVCWETFKWPKLLPCKHTFCIGCLYEYLDELQDKSNMVCPLCREPCFVPDKGFEDFPNNYFVEAEKITKICQECEKAEVSHVCYRCNIFLCVKCILVHIHTKKSSNVDNDQENRTRSNFSLSRMNLKIKTELLCEQFMIFIPECTNSQIERSSIRSLHSSLSGGVFVSQQGCNYLSKYNKHGRIKGKVPLVGSDDVSAVLETSIGHILIAHFSIRSVVSYGDGNPNFKHFHFAKTPFFHPLGMSELSNGNIVIGGPTHMCSPKCTQINKECEIETKSYGIIQIVSKTGDILKEIVKESGEYLHKLPIDITSCRRFDSFAVCDQSSKKVVIYDNTGCVRSTFKGAEQMPFSLFSNNGTLLPMAACTTTDGNYVVADPRQDYLYMLNPYGKYIGNLSCENGEDLTHTSALCVDSENNIWLAHHLYGTVSVLKTKFYKNVLDKPVLPSLPFLSHDLGLTGLENVDPNLWLQFLSARVANN